METSAKGLACETENDGQDIASESILFLAGLLFSRTTSFRIRCKLGTKRFRREEKDSLWNQAEKHR